MGQRFTTFLRRRNLWQKCDLEFRSIAERLPDDRGALIEAALKGEYTIEKLGQVVEETFKLVALLRRRRLWDNLSVAEQNFFLQDLPLELDAEIITKLPANFDLKKLEAVVDKVTGVSTEDDEPAEVSQPANEKIGLAGLIEEMIEEEEKAKSSQTSRPKAVIVVQPQPEEQVIDDFEKEPMPPAVVNDQVQEDVLEAGPVPEEKEVRIEVFEPETDQVNKTEEDLPAQLVVVTEDEEVEVIRQEPPKNTGKGKKEKPVKSGPSFVVSFLNKAGTMLKRPPKEQSEPRERPQKRERHQREPGEHRGIPIIGRLFKKGPKRERNYSGSGTGSGGGINWVTIASIVGTLAFVGFLVYVGFTGGTSPTMPQQDEFFAAPEIARNNEGAIAYALDIRHNDIGTIHLFLIGCSLFLVWLVFMDASQRRERSDFIGLAGAVLVFILAANISHYYVIPKLVDERGLTPDQLVWATTLLDVVFGLFLTAIGIVIVYLVSRQGRRDMTPMAGLFAITGTAGMVFATLGSIQMVLRIPDAPVLPIKQLVALFLNKELPQVWLSVCVYTLLIIGAVIFLREAWKSVLAAQGFTKIATVVSMAILPLAYFPVRIYFPQYPPVLIFLSLFALSAGYGFKQEGSSYRNGHVDPHQDASPLGLGETREGTNLIPPYDKMAFSITILILEIIAVGIL